MRVIVAIDGSEGSRRALSLVAGMALPPGSGIRVTSALGRADARRPSLSDAVGPRT